MSRTTVAPVHSSRTGPPGYRVTLRRTPEAAAESRSLVGVVLTTWGLAHAVDDTALTLTELINNAVTHGGGPTITIVIDRPARDRVLVAVIDHAPGRVPERRTPAPDAENGRGLLIVNTIAENWGYTLLLGRRRRPWGKKVWAKLRVPQAGSPS